MRARPTKGLHKATARQADGTRKTYWYAWRGGPRLEGEPGSHPFEAGYRKAIRDRNAGRHGQTLAGLIAAYRASPEFAARADSTLKEWARFLDLIQQADGPLAIGTLPVEALDTPRVRQHLLAWRDQWRSTPRKADYAMQVLSAALSWAVGRGMISANVVLGHSGLYTSDRAELIWSPEEIHRFVEAAPSPEVAFIVRLACLTGLRRADLVSLEWTEVSEVAITKLPGKNRRRRQPKHVIVPLLDETLDLLAEIRRQQDRRWAEVAATAKLRDRLPPPKPTTVLSNTRAKSWSVDGLEHQIVDTKNKAGINKHLHDCRGTFATRLRLRRRVDLGDRRHPGLV